MRYIVHEFDDSEKTGTFLCEIRNEWCYTDIHNIVCDLCFRHEYGQLVKLSVYENISETFIKGRRFRTWNNGFSKSVKTSVDSFVDRVRSSKTKVRFDVSVEERTLI